MFRFHFSPLCRGCEHQPSVIFHLCSSHPPSNVYRTLPQKLCVIVKVNILRYQGEFFSPNAERKSEKKKNNFLGNFAEMGKDVMGQQIKYPPHFMICDRVLSEG